VLFTQREDFTGAAVPFCQGHLHAGTVSQFRAATRTVPPNNPICLAVGLSGLDCTPDQIGGYVRASSADSGGGALWAQRIAGGGVTAPLCQLPCR
jgi:hypothetical protein